MRGTDGFSTTGWRFGFLVVLDELLFDSTSLVLERSLLFSLEPEPEPEPEPLKPLYNFHIAGKFLRRGLAC